MRFYSLRSIIVSCLALVASAFVFSMPASAATIYDGPDVLQVYSPHHDVAVAIRDLSAAMDRLGVQREAAQFLDNDHSIKLGADSDRRSFRNIKPEYAASYATDGLNFIDLQRRC